MCPGNELELIFMHFSKHHHSNYLYVSVHTQTVHGILFRCSDGMPISYIWWWASFNIIEWVQSNVDIVVFVIHTYLHHSTYQTIRLASFWRRWCFRNEFKWLRFIYVFTCAYNTHIEMANIRRQSSRHCLPQFGKYIDNVHAITTNDVSINS